MERTASYRRAQRYRVINRKKKIIKEQGNYWHYKYEGELSKGKIHCSCWMCRRKSYDIPKIQDVRNFMKLQEQVLDETDSRNSLVNELDRQIRV